MMKRGRLHKKVQINSKKRCNNYICKYNYNYKNCYISCEMMILTTVLSLVLISGFYFYLEIETFELVVL